jgi:phosphate:Na+ symporter
MRELNNVRINGDDPAAILSLSSLKLDMELNDSTSNGKLDQLIRENQISAQMATSLMNDSSYAYAYAVAKNLIQMGEILFAKGDLGMKSAERDIALTTDEVTEIISDDMLH